jgi:cytochrome b6-f complex iron-sulfur subunit
VAVQGIDRRTLLRQVCAGCVAFGLSACGPRSRAAGGSPTRSETPGAVLARLADVPVGSSASATSPGGRPLLLARPTATTVVAFSAICTHLGCLVEPAGRELGCPCHDSVFDAFTGRVLSGPAPAPLPAYAVAIRGADVVSA